jgi:hypothetical protein
MESQNKHHKHLLLPRDNSGSYEKSSSNHTQYFKLAQSLWKKLRLYKFV